MKISKQARRDARELFRLCMTEYALDENLARKAVSAVIQKKPRGYIAILSHLERLFRLEVARRTATIESAVPLSPQAQAEIEGDLSGRYGPGLVFHFTENPALIGGARIQVGGDVYDGTVQGRLEQLRSQN